MKYATLCSGIGAPEVAFDRFGWECAYQSEIEPFPCAVLSHHWPHVPNYGDMTRWREWPNHELDLVVAGTPCQAFSVAGLRNSLNDQRGNLTLEFAKYCNTTRPRFVLWENVPGVLNTKDNAFGCFLGALAGSYNALVPTTGRWTNAGLVFGPLRQIAWRILDAQHFGVPQRRRRVFILAGDIERCAGNWACARALFPFDESICVDVKKIHQVRENASRMDIKILSIQGNYHESAKQECLGISSNGIMYTLTKSDRHAIAIKKSDDDFVSIRKLIPRECERLQGFPDDHTLVNYRGKPASDGPRYNAIGNSMAVPVLEWIGRNLQSVL